MYGEQICAEWENETWFRVNSESSRGENILSVFAAAKCVHTTRGDLFAHGKTETHQRISGRHNHRSLEISQLFRPLDDWSISACVS